jgi:hypothetical protein
MPAAEQGTAAAEIRLRVSRQTFYTWKKKDLEMGVSGSPTGLRRKDGGWSAAVPVLREMTNSGANFPIGASGSAPLLTGMSLAPSKLSRNSAGTL